MYFPLLQTMVQFHHINRPLITYITKNDIIKVEEMAQPFLLLSL